MAVPRADTDVSACRPPKLRRYRGVVSHPVPYVAVAVDHGQSLVRRVVAAGLPAGATEEVRARLVASALASGAEGVVIPPDASLLDAVAPRRPAGQDVWLGLPDLVAGDEPAWDAALERAGMLVDADAVAGIKVAFVRDDALDWLAALHRAAAAAGAARRLIVEPYFRADDPAPLRAGVLAACRDLPNLMFLKCDVDGEARHAELYSAAGLPWLARSDGLSFAAFATAYRIAATHGCAGVMAGAALWSDAIADAADDAVAARVDALRAIGRR